MFDLVPTHKPNDDEYGSIIIQTVYDIASNTVHDFLLQCLPDFQLKNYPPNQKLKKKKHISIFVTKRTYYANYIKHASKWIPGCSFLTIQFVNRSRGPLLHQNSISPTSVTTLQCRPKSYIWAGGLKTYQASIAFYL